MWKTLSYLQLQKVKLSSSMNLGRYYNPDLEITPCSLFSLFPPRVVRLPTRVSSLGARGCPPKNVGTGKKVFYIVYWTAFAGRTTYGCVGGSSLGPTCEETLLTARDLAVPIMISVFILRIPRSGLALLSAAVLRATREEGYTGGARSRKFRHAPRPLAPKQRDDRWPPW